MSGMVSLLRAPHGHESGEMQSTPLGRWAATVVLTRTHGRRSMEYIAPRYQRSGLAWFGVCFFAVAISVANYDDRPTWTLWLISGLFAGAGMSHVLFALRPWSDRLYRLCLAFIMTATASRVLVLPVWRAGTDGAGDEVWVALATIGLFVPFALLYWWFWRTEVLPWHRKLAQERT